MKSQNKTYLDKVIFYLFVTWIILFALDTITTHIGLSRADISEGNIFVRVLFANYGMVFGELIHSIIFLAVVAGLYSLSKIDSIKYKLFSLLVLMFLNMSWLLIVVNNFKIVFHLLS